MSRRVSWNLDDNDYATTDDDDYLETTDSDSKDTYVEVEKTVSDGEMEWLNNQISSGNDEAIENLESGYIKLKNDFELFSRMRSGFATLSTKEKNCKACDEGDCDKCDPDYLPGDDILLVERPSSEIRSEIQLQKLKLPELKCKLTELGLPFSGNKSNLVERLALFYREQEQRGAEKAAPVQLRKSIRPRQKMVPEADMQIGPDQQKVTYTVTSENGYSQTYVMMSPKSLDQNTLINTLIKNISSDPNHKGKKTIKITQHKYGAKKRGKAGGARAGYSGARQALAPYLPGGGAAKPGQVLQSQQDTQVRPAAPAPHPGPFVIKLPQLILRSESKDGKLQLILQSESKDGKLILQSESKDGKETPAEKIQKIVSRLAAIKKETDQIWKEVESNLDKKKKEMAELEREVELISHHLDQKVGHAKSEM